jgi:large subunit ribosomal protein L22
MANRAISRYIRISPRKLRMVVDPLRKKSVQEAINILSFCKKRGAKFVEKTLMSAVSNTVQSGNADLDKLFIKKIIVDPGPIMKRYRAASMGRGMMIRKRTSHLKIELDVR